MRLSQIFYTSPTRRQARRVQREAAVPFQMLLPLKLKKTVSGKSDRTKEAPCMQEMALMFACFKKTEFDQEECLKEVTSFQTCYNAAKEKSAVSRDQERKGVLVAGEKRLTHRQMNQLLKAFPPQNQA